jgi:signal transduction histidine kinase
LSFRRDVRLFLSVLVGFLILIVLILLGLLNDFLLRTQEAIKQERETAAEYAVVELARSFDQGDLDARAQEIMARRDIAGIAIDGAAPRHWGLTSGIGWQVVHRMTRFGPGSFFFDASRMADVRRRFLWTAAICLFAISAGATMLMLYLPRITRPIEELLSHASELAERGAEQEETAYLIETFRDTIERLHSQEDDLKRLHEFEKSRADELELISATLTRSLTSGFISIGAAGYMVQMNGAAREILGIPASEPVAGRSVSGVLGETELARVLERSAASGETIARQEIEHTTPSGTITIGLAAVPLVDERSKMLGTLALFTDLTPIKTLEARVRTMQTLADVGEISAGIAHEFRNSLSTILGYLRLARREPLPSDAEARIAAAAEEANLLSAAVQRLLAFGRPMRLHVESVDLGELSRATVERLREPASDVEFVFTGDAPVVEGDRALIARALENIVRNAIEALAGRDSGKRVEVQFSSDPPGVTVIDNGSGLDPAAAARLFLPFQSEKPGGFGLGLSLSRKIMLLHGGDVELRGAPGEGAAVTLSFRAVPSPSDAAPQPA